MLKDTFTVEEGDALSGNFRKEYSRPLHFFRSKGPLILLKALIDNISNDLKWVWTEASKVSTGLVAYSNLGFDDNKYT